MERAQPPHQVEGVDADDRPVGDELAEDAEGDAIGGIVEGGPQGGGVADVEVGVAGREPLPGEDLYAGLLKIFIGADPVDKRLKAGLLGAPTGYWVPTLPRSFIPPRSPFPSCGANSYRRLRQIERI